MKYESFNPVWKRSTEPAIEPLSLNDAKLHLRVDGTAEDTMISAYLQAARELCEEYTGRSLITQTWQLKLDDFPGNRRNPHYVDSVIELPRAAPLQNVSSIQYIDANGATQTLDSDIYDVDTHSTPGRVILAYGKSWPSTRNQQHAVTVSYVTGYGDAASDVPERFVQAIRLLLGDWYENRETVSFANNVYELPMVGAAKALLNINRVVRL